MLVLSRKSQESVVVGGTSAVDRKLIVTVIEIRGRKVRLGFEVPVDVPVHRLEVWERIHAGVERGNPAGDKQISRSANEVTVSSSK
jgi:carbon storage regulator